MEKGSALFISLALAVACSGDVTFFFQPRLLLSLPLAIFLLSPAEISFRFDFLFFFSLCSPSQLTPNAAAAAAAASHAQRKEREEGKSMSLL